MKTKELIQTVMDYYRGVISEDFDAIENGRPLQQSPYIIDAIQDYIDSGLDIDEATEQQLLAIKGAVEGENQN